jgi:hypothetical protein
MTTFNPAPIMNEELEKMTALLSNMQNMSVREQAIELLKLQVKESRDVIEVANEVVDGDENHTNLFIMLDVTEAKYVYLEQLSEVDNSDLVTLERG